MTKHYPVMIEFDQGDQAYIVTCPSFQSCRSYGKTIDEALQNIEEAIQLCLEEEAETANTAQVIGFREVSSTA